jgi:hypothetical protein
VLGPGMGAVIKDPDTGKSMRTPYEAGYRVRSEGPEGWQEYVLPETAIKGDVEMAGGGIIKKAAKALFKAPQEEALRLAQQRAALPVERGGLGLPKNNTSEQRATAMGRNTDAYHASKQNITGAFNPGYDDNLAFVTQNPDFANSWLGKGKYQKRFGKEAEDEVKAAEDAYRELKYGTMDFDSLSKLEGDAFHTEYDVRNERFKQELQKKLGIKESGKIIISYFPTLTTLTKFIFASIQF